MIKTIRYKVNDVVNDRKVIKVLPKLGVNIYYKTECLVCGGKKIIHQEALVKQRSCEFCYRLKMRGENCVTDPNFEVGNIIEYEGRQYKVVGKDTTTGKHPGGFKKWDYWLEDIETKNRKKTFIHQLQEAKKVG